MSERRPVVDRPDWTSAHLDLLRRAGADPLDTDDPVTTEALELLRWKLLEWHGGAGRDEHGQWRHRWPGSVRITLAGLALLAAVASLDGTAPPSELLPPGAEKEEGET
jgi:hypothetical protein